MASASDTVTPTEHCTWRAGPTYTVCLDLRNGSYVTLNDTGRIVWQGVATGLCLGRIAASLSNRFGIPYGSALIDVERMLSGLVDQGLLRWEERGS